MRGITNKERYSQFFTTGDPFKYEPFWDWFARIPPEEKRTLLEPFAGAGHIAKRFPEHDWACFDIDPTIRPLAGVHVVEQDTLTNFPARYSVCITNPPYIAKNAAKRTGIPFPETVHDDLYKLALERMLAHCRWVAAIIPESFITSGAFRERLQCVISIPEPIFEDTDHPTCLALFGPDPAPLGAGGTGEEACDFLLFSGDEYLGRHSELAGLIPEGTDIGFSFNDPGGPISIHCVDNTRRASIRFGEGRLVSPDIVTPAARSITRVSIMGLTDPKDIAQVIARANAILRDFRIQTKDVLLTPFRGLRKDGMYRRRLDYVLARRILAQAAADVLTDSSLSDKRGQFVLLLPTAEPVLSG